MEACRKLTYLELSYWSPETDFHSFAMNEFDEKENLFRDWLQHSGFPWCCKPILVMTRNILEENFSRERLFA
jgi:hypothetical protein